MLVIFDAGSHFIPGLAWTAVLLFVLLPPSCNDRRMPPHPAIGWDGGLLNFLNHSSHGFHLPSSWDYRSEEAHFVPLVLVVSVLEENAGSIFISKYGLCSILWSQWAFLPCHRKWQTCVSLCCLLRPRISQLVDGSWPLFPLKDWTDG
jgi:hypothetical protein